MEGQQCHRSPPSPGTGPCAAGWLRMNTYTLDSTCSPPMVGLILQVIIWTCEPPKLLCYCSLEKLPTLVSAKRDKAKRLEDKEF